MSKIRVFGHFSGLCLLEQKWKICGNLLIGWGKSRHSAPKAVNHSAFSVEKSRPRRDGQIFIRVKDQNHRTRSDRHRARIIRDRG